MLITFYLLQEQYLLETVTASDFFICIGSKFMKFQWTLICLHWFILTADLWNFNFLFILRLLEMESLSGNWAAVDGDDMVSGKTDEVCSAWVCCDNSNFALVWFFFFWTMIFACFLHFQYQIISALCKHASWVSSLLFYCTKFKPSRVTQKDNSVFSTSAERLPSLMLFWATRIWQTARCWGGYAETDKSQTQ